MKQGFWARVNVRGPDECWPWIGRVERKGHPNRPIPRPLFRGTYAARFALEVAGRPLGGDECACHSCDNPMCVNPAHLFRGSRSDNVADMVAKGRHRASANTLERRVALQRLALDVVLLGRGAVEAVVGERKTDIIWRYVHGKDGLPESFNAISRDLGISRERVSQLFWTAIERLELYLTKEK